MFRKLHYQMTLFSTFITGMILVTLTCVCLFISENSIKETTQTSFTKEVNAMIIHLQSQSSISLSWLNQLQENNHFLLYFYDNGTPLYAQRLYSDAHSDAVAESAKEYALLNCGIDVASTTKNVLPTHSEFTLTDNTSDSYYVSAGLIPSSFGTLGFIVLYPMETQQQQILSQRLLFAGVDGIAVICLFIFSWFFTGRMLLPIEENHKKQTYFISAASHELRTPLAVMLSGTDALGMAQTTEERSHFLHIIQSEGLRMQHLISDMLLLARSDSGSLPVTPTRCQPELLLMDAYEKFELSAHAKKLSLSLLLPEEQLPDCQCDPERIAQLFSILLDNAISYTPAGGRITLALSADTKHAVLRFSVSDTGNGVADADKHLIFDRFYRADSAHTDKKHFGLGLSIAKEIVTAHHGKLWVEDAKEGGACFVFTLPT